MKDLILVLLILAGNAKGTCRSIQVLPFGDAFVPDPIVFEASNGEITSSNFPENYNTNEQCGFIIKGPPGSRIRLEFTDYRVNVQANFLVLDGNSSPFGGIVHEFPTNTQSIPPPFESNSNVIGISFTTGVDNANTGWKLMYSIIASPLKSINEPIMFIDSSMSTILMAIGFMLSLLISGFAP